jgi:Tol biopolymer transport system component/DNA-binding winged helix-turn-helix (wHTH) protein
VFELDVAAGELRRAGRRVGLAEQPLRLLEVFVGRPGELVTREELRARLWPADTFVDFEHGLNAAVKRLRDALGDAADQPRFVETVPKRGYRFVAPVEVEPPLPADAVATPISPIAAEPDPVSAVAAAGIAGEASAASAARPFPRWVWAAPAVAAVAVVLAWVTATRRGELAVAEPLALRRLTFGAGRQMDPALSPDGRSVVYASDQSGNLDLWLQPLDGGPAVQLTTDPADDSQPDWAPDGSSMVFRSERDGGGIFTLSMDDHHVRRLLREGYAPRLSPDGTRLLYDRLASQGSEIVLAAADGTAARALGVLPLKEQDFALAVGWHPSGRVVVLSGAGRLVSLQVATADGGLQACELAAGVRQRFEAAGLGVRGRSVAWSSDGRELYFVGEAQRTADLWRISVDPVSLRVDDGPIRMTTGADAEQTPVTGRHGRAIAFAVARQSRRIAVVDLDETGRSTVGSPRFATTDEDEAWESGLSPDGHTLAFMTRSRGGRTAELRERNLDTGAVRTWRVSDAKRNELLVGMLWSPDATRFAYAFHTGGPPWLASSIRLLDRRSGEESIVTTHAPIPTYWENPCAWSRDGRSLLAAGGRFVKGRSSIVWLPLEAAPAAERAARVVVSSATEGLSQATPSPDGRWITYAAIPADGRTSAIYVIPATGGTPTRVNESTGWYDKPRWSADGRILYYLTSRGTTFNLWGMPFDTVTGSAGAPFQVTHFPAGGLELAGLEDMFFAAVSIRGGRVALTTRRDTSEIWILE